ncbi:MAG TPA: methyltransferase domain-containing protein [Actinomycetota bacterium]
MARVDRATWIVELRRVNEEEEDVLAPTYDERWGEIDETHRAFVERFLSMVPPAGRVLDAACGTGKYLGMVLESGRSVLGVDHAGACLVEAKAKHPGAETERHDLQDLAYREAFDGVMCVDAMEMIPPEDWPDVLRRFRRAIAGRGPLYLTVEIAPPEEVRAGTEEGRRRGLPLADGEVIWEEYGYHHYPSLDRVRTWLREAGFAIEDEEEQPLEDEGFAYHHVLARAV